MNIFLKLVLYTALKKKQPYLSSYVEVLQH